MGGWGVSRPIPNWGRLRGLNGGSPGPYPGGGRLRGLAKGGLQVHTQGGG